MLRWSLRTRVAVASIGVLAVGLLVLSAGFNVLLRSRLHADTSSTLRTRADAEQATLVVAGGRLRVRESPNDSALDRQAWVFVGQRMIENPATATAPVTRAVAALAGVARPTERTVPDRARLLAVPVRGAHGRRIGTVVVAVSLVPYEHTEQIALIGSVVLCAFLLIAGSLAVRWSIGSALRPVAEMTRRAADWSERDLHRRFDLGPPHDELTALASTFDGLLRRISSVLLHEQRFSAEVAHELRTPITGMRAEAELALQRTSDPAAHEHFERILAGTERMSAVIETLLNSARLDGGASAGSCDPLPAVESALAMMADAAQSRGVELNLAGGAQALMVDASSEIVSHALHPLLENAIRHAASRVDVDLEQVDGQVTVAIIDDGPGLAGQSPEAVFAPGVSSAGGAGLGLPLARRLARSCGGDVVAIAGAEGGRFELRLPGARSGAVQTA
jgi:signal transduction histidine kinase